MVKMGYLVISTVWIKRYGKDFLQTTKPLFGKLIIDVVFLKLNFLIYLLKLCLIYHKESERRLRNAKKPNM